MDLIKTDLFTAENSPSFKMLDVQGRVHTIATAAQAEQALELANQLQYLSGTGKVSGTDEDKIQTSILHTMPIFYKSHDEEGLDHHEIAQVARVISESKVMLQNYGQGGKNQHVTGTRAVAYPEDVIEGQTTCVFLVAKTVWYNENRAVANFPGAGDQARDAFLHDINSRLECGEVSFPRG
jgi:hypothetical protein